MANLRTDSPICLRIILAFLDFLSLVQPAPAVNLEGLAIVRECLVEVFKIKQSSFDDKTPKGLLVNLFSSPEASEQNEIKLQPSSPEVVADIPSSSSGGVASSDVPKEELFQQFCCALSSNEFFNHNEHAEVQMNRVKQIFDNAIAELTRSGCELFNVDNLAETLKSQGNFAMLSKLHSEAIELYSCAIALCGNNAIYYCNRAAALTGIQKYIEAIRDCLLSIQINPKYSKAYCRLGLAYYGQGNYIDAICKGYVKALQLDPNNESTHQNIQVAEQKLKDEYRRMQDRDMVKNVLISPVAIPNGQDIYPHNQDRTENALLVCILELKAGDLQKITALAQRNDQEPNHGTTSSMNQARGATRIEFGFEPSSGAVSPPGLRTAVVEILQDSEDDEEMTLTPGDLADLFSAMFPPGPHAENP